MSCPEHLPSTPDGHYFVHGGRLWRCSDPTLDDETRARLVSELMDARRDVGTATRAEDAEAERAARARVHAAKVALGERGDPWWGDGETYDRRAPKNTPYADWWARLGESED